MGREKPPAFVLLTSYIGLTRLPLGMEGVEVLLQPFLARLARIDGAAQVLSLGGLTHWQPFGLACARLPARCAARRPCRFGPASVSGICRGRHDPSWPWGA